MKLATLKDGTRDGQLAVVSRDLSVAHLATGICPTLQKALDDWPFFAPQLQDLYETLNAGKGARHAFAFEAARCMAPLPRAYLFVNAQAYPSHAERLRHATTPEPYLHFLGGDELLGPCDDITRARDAVDVDFGASLAVITDDVPMGADEKRASEAIRLLVLVNQVSLNDSARESVARDLSVANTPAAAFSPVAVTPDELGDAWDQQRVHLPVFVHREGKRVGAVHAAQDMAFGFSALIARAAHVRRLRAGAIVGAGIVSNHDASRGYACIGEKRAFENETQGCAQTPYLVEGETVRIEMFDAQGPKQGQSIFGAIAQKLVVHT
ncbi:MAG TPA: fumarylacetoacetate hydrolase family protein [Burkholderiaceae bacterium]|nr:fumarylacetoacetate hydrolase family protein [Burkholderiaceae bacterium]